MWRSSVGHLSAKEGRSQLRSGVTFVRSPVGPSPTMTNPIPNPNPNINLSNECTEYLTCHAGEYLTCLMVGLTSEQMRRLRAAVRPPQREPPAPLCRERSLGRLTPDMLLGAPRRGAQQQYMARPILYPEKVILWTGREAE